MAPNNAKSQVNPRIMGLPDYGVYFFAGNIIFYCDKCLCDAISGFFNVL